MCYISGYKIGNVQGTIDELYDMANSKITTYDFGILTIYSPIDFNDVISANDSRTFTQKMGGQLSVCMYNSQNLFCIKPNDYANSVEKLKTEFGSSSN